MNCQEKRINWKSGVGSEILSVVIAIVAFAFMAYICVFFGIYNSEIQAQIMADIITDGSIAYAQNEMNLCKPALEEMSKKLYQANSAYNNGVELVGMSGAEPEPISKLVGGRTLSDAEKRYILPRAQLMSGTVKTLKYSPLCENIFSVEECVDKWGGDINDPQYADIAKLQDRKEEYYDVSYYGPRYKDEYITVSVTAKCKIPLFSGFTTKTKSATAISIALVPFNSRVPANGNLQGYFDSIEQKAYAGLLTGGSGPDVVEYGSFRYKMLLTARRALGDGYHSQRQHKYSHWPEISRLPSDYVGYDTAISYTGDNAYNYLKTCYWFVSSCFCFDGMSSLQEALGHPHTVFNRNVNYYRVVSAEEIWEEMHPEEIEITSSKNSVYHSDTGWFEHKDDSGSTWEWVGEGYDYTKTVDGDNATWLIQTTPPKTLAEELNKYGNLGWDPGKNGGGSEEGSSHIWEVASADPCPPLQVGDILVWESPNWYPHVSPELQALAAMKEKPADFSMFDQPSGAAISHYAIYFGDDKLLHMTGDGVCISSLDQRIVSAPGGWDGPVICEIIRFSDEGNAGSELSDPSAPVNLSWFNEDI